MYASSRSVRKAQGTKGESKAPQHNNGKITEGRGHRIQLIKDKFGFVTKQIIHYSPRRLKVLQKYSELQKKYQEALEEEMKKKNPEVEKETPVTE